MALCSTSETRTTVGEAAFGYAANAENLGGESSDMILHTWKNLNLKKSTAVFWKNGAELP